VLNNQLAGSGHDVDVEAAMFNKEETKHDGRTRIYEKEVCVVKFKPQHQNQNQTAGA